LVLRLGALECHTMWLQYLLPCSYMEDGKMEVGIRELKNHLSQYLAVIGEGGEIVVTDRGRAVARITAIETERTIDRLIADGVVTPARLAKRRAPSSRVRAKEPVSPLVLEQRR
jgi:prevent-host-death family protein